jgi:hypothetical protein
MTNLSEAAAKAKETMQRENPSVSPDKPTAERTRIPLSVPQRKLEVPDIPGYYTRWFRGTPQRLAQAERAGFEFVTPDEIQLNNVSVGGDAKKDGNSDLGTRVSVVEGGEIDGVGQAVRMYLMKQKLEYYQQDAALSQKRNDSVADALTAAYHQGSVGGPAPGERPEDQAARYVDKARSKVPDLFRRKVK